MIAAVVVATALCADRVAPAAPQQPRAAEAHRPAPVTQLARTLAMRLTVGLRRAVSSTRLLPDRTWGQDLHLPAALAPVGPVEMVHASSSSPFRFRLPPPLA
jgi:hypothetical protein